MQSSCSHMLVTLLAIQIGSVHANVGEVKQETLVQCGGHTAPNCAACPQDKGKTYCNKDCQWIGSSHFKGECVPNDAKPQPQQKFNQPKPQTQAQVNVNPAKKKARVGVPKKQVVCGGHTAPNCAACPQDKGKMYCNKDCQWIGEDHFDGKCVDLEPSPQPKETEANPAMPQPQPQPQPQVNAVQTQVAEKAQIGVVKTEVVCGGHFAPNCAACPRGNGKGWCNKDCQWIGDHEYVGECVPKAAANAQQQPQQQANPQPEPQPQVQATMPDPQEQSGDETAPGDEMAPGRPITSTSVGASGIRLKSQGSDESPSNPTPELAPSELAPHPEGDDEPIVDGAIEENKEDAVVQTLSSGASFSWGPVLLGLTALAMLAVFRRDVSTSLGMTKDKMSMDDRERLGWLVKNAVVQEAASMLGMQGEDRRHKSLLRDDSVSYSDEEEQLI